jgi:hypothetical protein
MHRFKTYLLASAGFLALITILTLAGPGRVHSQGPAAGLSVKVINGSTEPVPVSAQGTISIGGSVNATQSGPWSFTLNGTPNVNIANSPTVSALQSGDWIFGLDPAKNIVQDPTAAGKLDTTNSHLNTIQTATGKLAFDGSNNLKTAPQGTQNVNIVGGAITSQASTASRLESFGGALDPGSVASDALSQPMNVSTITMESGPHSTRFSVQIPIGPNATESFDIADVPAGDVRTLVFPQRIKVTNVGAANDDHTFGSSYHIVVIGD